MAPQIETPAVRAGLGTLLCDCLCDVNGSVKVPKQRTCHATSLCNISTMPLCDDVMTFTFPLFIPS